MAVVYNEYFLTATVHVRTAWDFALTCTCIGWRIDDVTLNLFPITGILNQYRPSWLNGLYATTMNCKTIAMHFCFAEINLEFKEKCDGRSTNWLVWIKIIYIFFEADQENLVPFIFYRNIRVSFRDFFIPICFQNFVVYIKYFSRSGQ